MTISNQYSFCIEHSHPCFLGHFPGNPIVPGAVILEQVMLAWGAYSEDNEKTVCKRISHFDFSKFLSPLKPEIQCSISFMPIRAKLNTKNENNMSEMTVKMSFIVSTLQASTEQDLVICKGRFVYGQ